MDFSQLKDLLRRGDPAFWEELRTFSLAKTEFDELFALSAMRKRALAKGFTKPPDPGKPLRFALLGGYSLYPLHELVEHLLEMRGIKCELFIGDFDNYVSEIMDSDSKVYEFKPDCVFLLPFSHRYKYQGRLWDARERQEAEALGNAQQILQLCSTIHAKTRAEVVLGNFVLPAGHDPGAYRSRTLGSDWSFLKRVNLELGLTAPSFVHLCDLEFLAYRRGGIQASDDRGWFESKQPGSASFIADVAHEIARLVASLRQPPKKVLALDLDNTLWGGIIGDDGMEGIEIGDTSPRGEAFKAFQKYVLSLQGRGVLLAVCSKNDFAKALEPFEKHPEMVLKREHFVSFKANWEPKSENLRQMAAELNLGLDSFVFADDNPAELEIVRQFIPEVCTLLLGPDAADYVRQLQDSRFFEPRSLTAEDTQRTGQYQSNSRRKETMASVTDMGAYLESLAMEATIHEFQALDVPRLTQLINKSNQFNLTTRRRTEAGVSSLLNDPEHVCFSIRLKDRFGDHGLIAIVIAKVAGETLEVDTWLMSCRVLKRQVEEETINEIMRLASSRGCSRVKGTYLPTTKNEMVLDLYQRMGFTMTRNTPERREFEREVSDFRPSPTAIQVTHRAYESGRSNCEVAGHL
jgi:FkbH-like protein